MKLVNITMIVIFQNLRRKVLSIYCEGDLLFGLKKITFPKTKDEIIAAIEKIEEVSKASLIALDELEDKVQSSMSQICENK